MEKTQTQSIFVHISIYKHLMVNWLVNKALPKKEDRRSTALFLDRACFVRICFFFEIKARALMLYKKKVPHIKWNEAKPYNAQLIKENGAKTQHDVTPPHPRKETNKKLPKQAPSCNDVLRQNWRSPLQAWVETHRSSIH